MKNNKWPAPDEKPDAFVQKQKDDLEDIANTIFYAMDTPPENLSKPTPCVPNRIIVVNPGEQEITPEILQQIADEQNVPVSELTVLTKEMYDRVMGNATLCPQVPDAKTLNELHIRDNMTVPELMLCFNERDDSRPWYARFDKKRKGRR